jgi:hypothetical protein
MLFFNMVCLTVALACFVLHEACDGFQPAELRRIMDRKSAAIASDAKVDAMVEEELEDVGVVALWVNSMIRRTLNE